MKYIGLNPLKVEGSRFETAYGYSKFVKMKLDKKNYVPVLNSIANNWGVKKEEDRVRDKVFCSVCEKEGFLDFYSHCKDIELSGIFIAGYPSIKVGESPWGPFNGYFLGQVNNYKKMNVFAKWDFKVSGNANFAFDIWLTKESKGRLSNEAAEVMVWIDYNFNLPDKQIGETKDFIIKYKEKGHNGANRISFIAKKKNGKTRFDLAELFTQCKNKISNIDSYFIRSIEVGVEFSKNTEANAKLFNLNFDFETKK